MEQQQEEELRESEKSAGLASGPTCFHSVLVKVRLRLRTSWPKFVRPSRHTAHCPRSLVILPQLAAAEDRADVAETACRRAQKDADAAAARHKQQLQQESTLLGQLERQSVQSAQFEAGCELAAMDG